MRSLRRCSACIFERFPASRNAASSQHAPKLPDNHHASTSIASCYGRNWAPEFACGQSPQCATSPRLARFQDSAHQRERSHASDHNSGFRPTRRHLQRCHPGSGGRLVAERRRGRRPRLRQRVPLCQRLADRQGRPAGGGRGRSIRGCHACQRPDDPGRSRHGALGRHRIREWRRHLRQRRGGGDRAARQSCRHPQYRAGRRQPGGAGDAERRDRLSGGAGHAQRRHGPDGAARQPGGDRGDLQ